MAAHALQEHGAASDAAKSKAAAGKVAAEAAAGKVEDYPEGVEEAGLSQVSMATSESGPLGWLQYSAPAEQVRRRMAQLVVCVQAQQRFLG